MKNKIAIIEPHQQKVGVFQQRFTDEHGIEIFVNHQGRIQTVCRSGKTATYVNDILEFAEKVETETGCKLIWREADALYFYYLDFEILNYAAIHHDALQ